MTRHPNQAGLLSPQRPKILGLKPLLILTLGLLLAPFDEAISGSQGPLPPTFEETCRQPDEPFLIDLQFPEVPPRQAGVATGLPVEGPSKARYGIKLTKRQEVKPGYTGGSQSQSGRLAQKMMVERRESGS